MGSGQCSLLFPMINELHVKEMAILECAWESFRLQPFMVKSYEHGKSGTKTCHFFPKGQVSWQRFILMGILHDENNLATYN